MREIFEKYRLPKAYIDFLHKNKKEISQALFNAKIVKTMTEAHFMTCGMKICFLRKLFPMAPIIKSH